MTYPITTKDSVFDSVILGDGDFPLHPVPLTILGRSKYVCCCDGAGEKLISHGIMPDAIVGDGDSLSADFKKKYSGIMHIVSEQEDNDQTKATRFCIDKGRTHIAYLGSTGKREDHTLGNIALLTKYSNDFGISPVMITNYGYFIPAKGDNVFLTFKGQQVSIFNVSCTTLSGVGFVWKPYAYSSLWQGTLNEASGNSVVLRGDGDYVVFLTHEAKSRP